MPTVKMNHHGVRTEHRAQIKELKLEHDGMLEEEQEAD